MLLAVDCSIQVLNLKKSSIPHSARGMVMFAAPLLGKDQILGYFYGSLV